jgi:hypothetical protein
MGRDRPLTRQRACPGDRRAGALSRPRLLYESTANAGYVRQHDDRACGLGDGRAPADSAMIIKWCMGVIAPSMVASPADSRWQQDR